MERRFQVAFVQKEEDTQNGLAALQSWPPIRSPDARRACLLWDKSMAKTNNSNNRVSSLAAGLHSNGRNQTNKIN